jgi:hypothetical protein
MFVSQETYEAEVEIRAEEARKLRLEREAMRAKRAEGAGRPWRWRVETGMEGVFQSLLGWLLPSQPGEVVEAEQALPEPGGARPATVPVQGEDSEWAVPPLPYFGWSCYA